MGAENPVRRMQSAKQLAARFGVTDRTARRIMAEPRDQFRARAADRRARVLELRAQGLKLREVAAELDIPLGTVGRIVHDARKQAEREAAEQQQQAS